MSFAAHQEKYANLEAFPIFPSGMQYMLGKIRDQATFPIFLQNFPEDKLTLKLACKSDDVCSQAKNDSFLVSLIDYLGVCFLLG
ncbi:hypothetical protein DVH24_033066 [Malus domestica]|uniref:Uncharacterized protein n=1 Tax=Malus domestica TaxID=3750 RepID=A0A498J9K9_MALDO|nr:hypothetical protein DVH24_033066 [Malus domestica]